MFGFLFISLSNKIRNYAHRENNKIESYDLPNWSNNIFKVIVEYLKTK